MSLNHASVSGLWKELKALGPSFIIDKGHDFGSERTGKKDKPAGFNKSGGTKAGVKFLSRFCKLLCSAFVSDFPPDSDTGEIIWANQKIIYYTTPVYALLWSAVKSHSIDPFFDNTEAVYLKKYPIRAGKCWGARSYPFKDNFFKRDGPAKDMKKAALTTSLTGNPCNYDALWNSSSGVTQNNTRQIEFLVGAKNEMKTMAGPNTKSIIGGIWRGQKDSIPEDKIVISDSPVKKQKQLISNLVSNSELKAGTSSFLDAANSTKGEQKVYGIRYNMPFLAAKKGNIKYYINVSVSNNNGGDQVNEIGPQKPYYTLVYSLWSKQGIGNWTKVPNREYILHIQESVKLFPGEVSLLGCLINTLVNRNSGNPTSDEQYQWDNVKTIINSMTNPINPVQRLIKQEQILANLIGISKIYADTIYSYNEGAEEEEIATQITNRVKFVFAFIMQIKTMGDFSSLKDCEWFENTNGDECFILTKDTFLRKIVNPFYKGYRGKLIGDKNLKTSSPYFNDKAFTIRRETNPQVGGQHPIDIDKLNRELNNTDGGICERVFAESAGLYDTPNDFCSFEYGQMKNIDAAIATMNVQNIYDNIKDFFSGQQQIFSVNADFTRAYVEGNFPLHDELFGGFFSFSDSNTLSLQNHINLRTSIGRPQLRDIVSKFKSNYPKDYYLNRASTEDNINDINYLFLRAWQFREYALKQCREYVPIGDETIATHPCVFPVDMLLDEKIWFKDYFESLSPQFPIYPSDAVAADFPVPGSPPRERRGATTTASPATPAQPRRRTRSSGRAKKNQGGNGKKKTKRKKKRKKKTKRRRKKKKKTKKKR